jgi:hypothetical protein
MLPAQGVVSSCVCYEPVRDDVRLFGCCTAALTNRLGVGTALDRFGSRNLYLNNVTAFTMCRTRRTTYLSRPT